MKSLALFDNALAAQVTSEVRVIDYYDRTVMVFRVEGKQQPSFFGNAMVDRQGSETIEVPQSDFMRIFARFAPK
jgi:hypothetical protein